MYTRNTTANYSVKVASWIKCTKLEAFSGKREVITIQGVSYYFQIKYSMSKILSCIF
jgi:hypothetical protein